jgi:Fe2+ transport system protein FeoA
MPGESGHVRRVVGNGSVYRRILDMGVSKGTLIEMELEAPLKDPIKVKVRGYALSLRRSEARMIELK